eukprot:271408_1
MHWFYPIHSDSIMRMFQMARAAVHVSQWDNTRKLFVKDMKHLQNKRIIRIKRSEISVGVDVYINESDSGNYRFAMYSSNESVHPISNATQLELTVLKDEKEMPPRNTEYKPTCIDSGAVFQVKDDQNKQINIYWSIPPKSFGNISYKIVTNNVRTKSS